MCHYIQFPILDSINEKPQKLCERKEEPIFTHYNHCIARKYLHEVDQHMKNCKVKLTSSGTLINHFFYHSEFICISFLIILLGVLRIIISHMTSKIIEKKWSFIL